MELKVYLSGEIHSNWREELMQESSSRNLPVEFSTPVTVHEASDEVGNQILGSEKDAFWKDHKSAKINSIRIKLGIQNCDIVVIKFGEKYRQWNAAFDAGQAAALGIPYIVIHPDDFTHALKEVDAQAMAVAKSESQVVEILEYVTKQK